MRATPLLAACLLGEASLIYAVLINITVDDWLPNRNTNERLTYTSAWKIGQDCVGCVARPDPKTAYRGSWHDTTYDETSLDCNQRDVAFLTFNGMSHLFARVAAITFMSFALGSALYVYGIQGRTNGNPTGHADLSFFIDEQLYQNNSYGSRGAAGYTYDVLLFAVDSLPLQIHTFKLQNGRHGGGISTVLLDYFIYTTQVSLALLAR